MKTEEMNGIWSFSPTLEENDEILCPECEKWSSHTLWIESEVSCELCGEHPAIVCPCCEIYWDHVYSPTFTTRKPTSLH